VLRNQNISTYLVPPGKRYLIKNLKIVKFLNNMFQCDVHFIKENRSYLMIAVP
jgi:hypothetical protein